MTYLVLARKWRPRSFDTLVGQDHVVRALTHALDTQRLHHAWLFTGTRGVGKTTLSRILAKSLNCETGITARPCGQCRACIEIDAGRYVDYVELDAASNRGVDEMTQLLEQAVYAPSSARFKVYMIDEVHMLTGHAFNAMLKTLEEPPAHVKFILATTDPQKIPVTVLSRCLQFNLKHMTVESIVSHLDAVLREERLEFEVPALRLLAQSAGGSMRDALSLTDQAIAYSAGNLTLDAVRGMLGTIDQRHLLRLLQGLAQGSAHDVIAVADELASRGLSYSGALADLAVLLSHVAIHQRVPGVLPADDPQADDIASLAVLLHPDLVQLYYSIAVHSRSELSLAPDEYAGFVMACLRMLALTPAAVDMPPSPPGGGSRQEALQSVGPAESPRVTSPAGQGSSGSGTVPAIEARAEAAPQSAPDSVSAAAVEPAPEPRPGPSREPEVAPGPRTGSTPEPESVSAPGNGRAPAPVGGAEPASGCNPGGPEIPAWEDAPEDAIIAPVEQGSSATRRDSGTELRIAPSGSVGTRPHEQSDQSRQTHSTPEEAQGAGTAEVHGSSRVMSEAAQLEDAAPYDDADDWEPVIDDGGFEQGPEPLSAMPEAMGEGMLESVALAALAPKQSDSSTRVPRLAKMTAHDWPSLAARLPLTGLAAELARESEWVGVEHDTVTLRVAIHSLAARDGLARLRTVLTEHFGKVLQVKIQFGATGDSTARAVETKRRAELQLAAEQAVANDPFILGLKEEFGAQVIPGSIMALDDARVA